jgi:ankyrin repeat protein
MLRRAPTAVDARVDHTNLTPLMLAAAGSKKNTDIIRHLKDNGAQVNAQDNKGRTPVMHAASAGRLFNLKFLLDEPSVDISIRDGEEKTVLFHLLSGKIEATDKEAKNVSLDILSLLRSRGLTPSIHARNYTALMAAAEAGNPHFIEDIIDCDDVQSWVNPQGPLKKTALMYAAESGSVSGVELLLAVPDIDPMLKDQNGWTALTFAAWMGSLDMVELLVEDPRVIMALEHGPSDAMISSSIPDGRGETQRLTNTDFALKVACEREHLGVIHRLLKDGRFDPNLCDDDGYTLLHYAVVYERVEVAEVLLEYGARTDISNHSGKTALDLAKGSERMIKILEEPREKN